jgi:hypothetical protein
MPITLAELICQRHGIAPERVPARVFRQGLPPGKRLLVILVRTFAGGAFAHDLQVAEDFCRATHREAATDAIDLLHRAPVYQHSFVRGTLGCRISGRRLAALADDLLLGPTG